MSKRSLYGLMLLCSCYGAMLASDLNAQNIDKSIQDIYVSINVANVPISKVLEQIELETGFSFAYNSDRVNLNNKVSLKYDKSDLASILMGISRESDLKFKRINNYIHIGKRKTFESIQVEEKISEQTRTITGKVTSMDDKEGLPGVNVIVKGTATGTVTDMEGNYTLEVPDQNAIIVFSSVGYLKEEVTVGNRAVIDISLTPDITALEEIVVVGYGTQKKVNLTGAVETVKGEELAKRPVMQASMALQGMTPGVTVTQQTGQPGADQGTIRIRGIGTLNNSDPLVLIDGVPGDMNNLDPNDIESMTVLKDAASSAIYGSRAANGVILITTKRAKSDALTIQYNGYAGVQKATQLPKYLGGLGYMNLLNKAYENQGQAVPYSDDFIQDWINLGPNDRDNYPDTDWQEEVIDDYAFQQHHYVSVIGGSEKIKVRGSLSYMDQDGLIGNTDFQRYSFRLNTDLKLSDKFNIGLDIAGNQENRREPNEGMFQVFYQINRASPLFLARYSDGTLGPGYNFANPLAMSTVAGENKRHDHQMFLNLRSDYELLEGLKLKFNFSPTYNFNLQKNFARKVDFFDIESGDYLSSRPQISSLSQSDRISFGLDLQGILSYEKYFGDHFFSALAGYNYYSFNNSILSAYRDGYVLPDYQELDAGSVENQRGSGTSVDWALRSYFGRVNYDYKGKYLFEANVRYDGSSRFASDIRYGVFPSFSAGWNLKEEEFMSDIDILDLFKIRASWGQLGNQNVPGGNYPYQSLIELGPSVIFGNTLVDGAAQNVLPNPNLTWENTEMTNIGMDASLFKGKLDVTAEFYTRRTYDIIFDIPIPATTGLEAPPVNAGEILNKGWDLRISHKNTLEQFQYRIGFNLSDVKTTVEDLKGTGPIFPDDLTIWDEGQEFNSLYGLVASGYFQSQEEVDNSPTQFGTMAPGDIKYVDFNDDGKINAEDRQIIGSTLPRLNYGLDFYAEYKGFDLTLFIQGVGKRDGYLNQEAAWAFYNGGKVQEKHLDYWTPENPDAAFPRLTYSLTNNQAVSSFWKTNASYLRLKNLQLGYSLSQGFVNSVGISKMRVYLSGQNLFSIDNYEGFDPESRLGNNNFYPFVSVYTVGLDITF